MSQKISFKNALCLVDGSSYFYRAFYAIRPLTTSSGLHVNAIYGFTTMLLKVLKDLEPCYVGIIFDSKEKTFRNELYAEYKANRSEMPNDLVEQIPYIKEVVEAFRIHTLEKNGYEADDLIGTVCERLKKEGIPIVIITADKDLMQLVTDHVTIYDTMKDREIRAEQVKEKFGVAPDHVTQVLALMGDSSDNVPGVWGIGLKTASDLIQRFGSIEQVLKNVDQLKGKLKESLERDREMAFLSRKLVTLDCHVPVDFTLADFKISPWNKDKLSELFTKFEFKRLLEQLGIPKKEIEKKKSSSPIHRNYETILEKKDFKILFSKISKAKNLVIDLETTSLDTKKAEIVGIALSFPEGDSHHSCYIPLLHQGIRQLSSIETLKKLKPIFESEHSQKWGQNIKYDALILAYHGIWLSHVTDDSMIASYILNSAERHNLDAMALKYLEHETIHYSDVTKVGKKQIGFDEVSIEVATEYAGEDADVTYRLVQILREKLKSEKRWFVYEKIDMPLVMVLTKMEFDGVKIDIPFLKEMAVELEQTIKEKEEEIYKLAGERFNIQSHQQLSKILFEKLNLSRRKKTKTGHSTDEEVLTALADDHELPKEILAYREAAKLKSTYVDALISLAGPKTNRVHTSYNQTIAATGRLSSSNPNLQNIPIRSEYGQKIRQAFIAEKGAVLLSADYSQVELRILAHVSQDPVLSKAFEAGEDIHTQTAVDIFGIFPTMVTPEMRRMAKAINFGLMYGLSSYGLSRQLKIPMKEADAYIERYFSRYAKVKEYMDATIEQARQRGYVETMTGRRRYLEGMRSSSSQLRKLAERMAINTPIQGSAADLIKIAMIHIFDIFKKNKMKTKMILQVHDELVFEVPKNELVQVKTMVKREMEGAMKLTVPIKVEIYTGKNWGKAHS